MVRAVPTALENVPGQELMHNRNENIIFFSHKGVTSATVGPAGTVRKHRCGKQGLGANHSLGPLATAPELVPMWSEGNSIIC